MHVLRLPLPMARRHAPSTRDVTVFTQHSLEAKGWRGVCTVRILHDVTELGRMDGHMHAWRNAPASPYVVTELASDPPTLPSVPVDVDILLLTYCTYPATIRGQRVAPAGRLAYCVCTSRATGVLIRAGYPYHSPVDMLIGMLGELGELRVMALPQTFALHCFPKVHWGAGIKTVMSDASYRRGVWAGGFFFCLGGMILVVVWLACVRGVVARKKKS